MTALWVRRSVVAMLALSLTPESVVAQTTPRPAPTPNPAFVGIPVAVAPVASPLPASPAPAASVSGSAPSATPDANAAIPTAAGVASDAPTAPAATESDLSHETYTATGTLSASLISPLDGSGTTATPPIEVGTEAGGGVELHVDGETIPFSRIGKRTVAKKDGATHYTYYGVVLHGGPNDIELVPLGANGARGATVHAMLFGPGKGTAVRAYVVGSLVADGRTPGIVRVQVTDAWGHGSSAGEGVRLSIVSGDATFAASGTAIGTTDPKSSPQPISANGAAPAAPALPSEPTPFPIAASEPGVAPSALATGASTTFDTPPLSAPTTARTDSALTNAKVLEARTEADGGVDVALVPGTTPGDVVVRIETEGGISTVSRFHLEPYLRAPIVDGIVTGGLGSIPGAPGEDPGVADGANSERARIALFGSGKVLHDSLLTFAYDTANTLDQTTTFGPFNANPDERPYLTYGDASARFDEALSRDHLYARLDRGSTSAMWGEFEATTGNPNANSLGGLDLLVNGFKFETGSEAAHLSAFNAKNDVSYARQVFTPTGLASLTTLLRPNIVVGSDVVELATLDRHTGIVTSEVGLVRDLDYTLDYQTGQLHFINVPLPFDAFFNPQQVVVRYEYNGLGGGSETTGGRLSSTFGKHGAFSAGVGYVNDSQGSGNVSLLSENLGGPFPGGAWTIEHATSKGLLGNADPALGTATAANAFGTGGDAERANLTTAYRSVNLELQLEHTSAGYDNPFGGLSTPGLLSYRAHLSRAISGGSVDVTYDAERNVGVGFQNSQNSLAAALKKKIGRRLAFAVGLAQRVYRAGSTYLGVPAAGQDVNAVPTPAPIPVASVSPGAAVTSYLNPDGSLTQLSLEGTYQISPVLAFDVARLIDVAGESSAIAAQPSETQAELSLALAKKGRLFVREMWNGTPVDSFAASSIPFTGQTNGTRATAFGISRSLGNATTVDSEYVVQNTGTGTDIYSDTGVKESFVLRKRLKGDVNVERANAIGPQALGFNLYGAALSYEASRAFRATGAYQLRTGASPGSTLSLGAVGNLSGSISLLASLQNANTSGYSSDDDRVSLAVRPTGDDRAVTLVGYERRSGDGAVIGERTDLLSAEQLFRPTRELELSGRLAYKLDGDSYYAAHTALLGLRADERLGGPGGRLDLAAEARELIAANGVTDANATGAAIEAGMTVGEAIRLAVGYNVSSAPDPALSSAPRRRGLYATFTSALDSIGGWGKVHR